MTQSKNKKVQLEDSWYQALEGEFNKPYFSKLIGFIKERREAGALIYPPGKFIFNAFNTTPFNAVKVVILGQDPYHGPGEAHGLCFSVQEGVKIPPSLRNIYKELNADLGGAILNSGDLTKWAQEGVFLLNTVLTVEHKSPASHKNRGWEEFTDSVIRILSERREGLVFMLWGAFAKTKKALIDTNKHLVLEAPHPASEVYAGGKAGFFGSRPFSKANAYLKEPIDWSL